MMTHPTNLGAITERRIERVLTREGCMELALHQTIMKCDGSDMQTKRIRNIRKRATAGLDGRDPSSPGELAHVPPNHLLMAQIELSGKETEAARAERDALAAELKALQDSIKPIHVDFDDARKWIAYAETAIAYGRIQNAEDCAAAAQALLSEIIAACEVMRNGLTKP